MSFATFQLRRDTAANWTSFNPVLAAGEIGYETDSTMFKVGDGVTAWIALGYGGIKGDTGNPGLDGMNYNAGGLLDGGNATTVFSGESKLDLGSAT